MADHTGLRIMVSRAVICIPAKAGERQYRQHIAAFLDRLLCMSEQGSRHQRGGEKQTDQSAQVKAMSHDHLSSSRVNKVHC